MAIPDSTKSLLAAITCLLCANFSYAEEISTYARVNQDGSLNIDGRTVRLYGIYIPETGRSCRTNINPPVCGSRAALALDLKVEGFVRCELLDKNSDGSFIGRCRVNVSHFNEGEDLSAHLLQKGWAVALPDADFEYHAMERIARSKGIGVWGMPVDNVIRNP